MKTIKTLGLAAIVALSGCGEERNIYWDVHNAPNGIDSVAYVREFIRLDNELVNGLSSEKAQRYITSLDPGCVTSETYSRLSQNRELTVTCLGNLYGEEGRPIMTVTVRPKGNGGYLSAQNFIGDPNSEEMAPYKERYLRDMALLDAAGLRTE